MCDQLPAERLPTWQTSQRCPRELDHLTSGCGRKGARQEPCVGEVGRGAEGLHPLRGGMLNLPGENTGPVLPDLWSFLEQLKTQTVLENLLIFKVFGFLKSLCRLQKEYCSGK